MTHKANTKGHRIHPTTLAHARELRQPLTPAEQKLWARLRNRQLNGFKFRRQSGIGPFVSDFYCAKVKLIVEVDGDSHAEQVEYDAARTEWLNARGCRVIRFWNDEINRNLEGVLERILLECQREPSPQPSPLKKARGKEPSPQPPPQAGGLTLSLSKGEGEPRKEIIHASHYLRHRSPQ